MRTLKSGDKGKAICAGCGLIGTTYLHRNVPFSDGVGIAKNILAGVCDGCGQVVAIPAQSAEDIRKARFEATS